MKLILGSSSPRRKEILENLGFDVEILHPNYNEEECKILHPKTRVRTLAMLKLKSILDTIEPSHPVLCGDTLLSFRSRSLETPKSLDDAREMLRLLRGKNPKVYSAIALFIPSEKKILLKVASAQVRFHHFSDSILEKYLESNEWVDAAGGYKLQKKGALLVKEIIGHPSTVVGLPIPVIYGIFKHRL